MEAISYIRWSSAKQTLGDTQRRQMTRTLDLCQRRGWTLNETLSIRDQGVSAYKSRNSTTGGLAALLAQAEAGKIARGTPVIVESVDRLSRDNIMEAETLFARLMRAGLRIITLEPEREYTWALINEQPFLKMELTLYFIRANEESETKAKRVSAAWVKRRKAAGEKKAIGNICPGWMKHSEGKFILIPERVVIVRRIFEMTIAGMGGGKIATVLNREGVKGFKGKPWHQLGIRRIIAGRTVLGEFQPCNRQKKTIGEAIKGYYPRAVDDETYYRANGCVKLRPKYAGRRGKGEANLFTGLLFDARDGTAFHLVNKGEGNGGTVMCSSGGRAGCPGSAYISFSYRLFEMAFLEFIRGLEVEPAETKSVQADIETTRGLIIENKERLARIKDMIRKNVESETLGELLSETEGQKKYLAERLERLQVEAQRDAQEELGSLRTLAEDYEEAEAKGELPAFRERLKSKIRSVVSEVWLLIEAPTRYSRMAYIQVFLRTGRIHWIFIKKEKKEGEYGSYEPDALHGDLRKWREKYKS